MENGNLQSRVEKLERHLRNMRMAVVIVVAFFVYESLMPPELRPGRAPVHKTLHTEELVVTDGSGEIFARLLIDDRKGRLVLSDFTGKQINLNPSALGLSIPSNGEAIEQLRITSDGVFIYNAEGQKIGELSR